MNKNRTLFQETVGMSKEQKEAYLFKRIDSLDMRIKELESQLKIVNKARNPANSFLNAINQNPPLKWISCRLISGNMKVRENEKEQEGKPK